MQQPKPLWKSHKLWMNILFVLSTTIAVVIRHYYYIDTWSFVTIIFALAVMTLMVIQKHSAMDIAVTLKQLDKEMPESVEQALTDLANELLPLIVELLDANKDES